MLERINTKIDAKSIFDITKQLPPGKNVLNKPTGDFFYDEWKLEDKWLGTPVEDLLSQLPNHGEARVIVLSPGQSYCAHADIDDRWHVTLDAEQSYLIDLDNNKNYKLEVDDEVYVMDSGRIHTATNFGFKPRYQLVIRKLLKRNDLQDPVTAKIELIDPPYNVRYLFDKSFSILLNQLEKEGKINNFRRTNNNSIALDIEKEEVQQLIDLEKTCGFKYKIVYGKF